MYREAANHLTSAVSEPPEYLLARRVSSLKRIRGGGSDKGKSKFKQDSIYADDGTIFTGYNSNWKSLPKEDHDKVVAERKKKNTPGVAKNENKRKLTEIQALTDDIAMMKRTVSQLAATKRNQDEHDDDTPRNDAGNQFGGRKAKAGKRQLPSLFGKIFSAFYAMYQFLTKRPHCVLRIVSSMCRRKKNKPGVNTLLSTHGRIELDSHADTVVLGSICVVLHHTGKVCEVSPYTDEYDAITDVPVVRGATLWTDQHTNEEYIFIFNEALWMGNTLTHSLINPNQLRAFGTIVQDNPYHTDPLGITPPPYDLEIPLRTAGTIIYANTHAPTQAELATLPSIAHTLSVDWDPHHVWFPSHDVEEARRATINAIQTRQQRDVHQYGWYNIEPGLQGTVVDPASFSIRLISAVQIYDPLQLKEDVPSAKTFHTSKRKSTVSASDLSEWWFIGLKQATHTIKSTSQRLLDFTIGLTIPS